MENSKNGEVEVRVDREKAGKADASKEASYDRWLQKKSYVNTVELCATFLIIVNRTVRSITTAEIMRALEYAIIASRHNDELTDPTKGGD